MGGKLLHREKAALRQCRIHRRARMTFGENQPIAIFPLRILRVNAQDAGVEHRHNLRDRKNRADMTAPADVGHLQPVTADEPRQRLGVGRVNRRAVKRRMCFLRVGRTHFCGSFAPCSCFSSAIFFALPNTPPIVSKNSSTSSGND